MQVGVFPRDVAYIRNLKASCRYFRLQLGEAYVIADCAATGELVRNYCLMQPLTFHNLSCPSNQVTLLTCSCSDAAEHSQRLSSTKCSISEDIDNFRSREVALYCIHRRVWEQLQFEESPQHDMSEDHENGNTEDSSVDILLLNPLLAAVYDGVTYGLVGRKRTMPSVYPTLWPCESLP